MFTNATKVEDLIIEPTDKNLAVRHNGVIKIILIDLHNSRILIDPIKVEIPEHKITIVPVQVVP